MLIKMVRSLFCFLGKPSRLRRHNSSENPALMTVTEDGQMIDERRGPAILQSGAPPGTQSHPGNPVATTSHDVEDESTGLPRVATK